MELTPFVSAGKNSIWCRLNLSPTNRVTVAERAFGPTNRRAYPAYGPMHGRALMRSCTTVPMVIQIVTPLDTICVMRALGPTYIVADQLGPN